MIITCLGQLLSTTRNSIELTKYERLRARNTSICLGAVGKGLLIGTASGFKMRLKRVHANQALKTIKTVAAASGKSNKALDVESSGIFTEFKLINPGADVPVCVAYARDIFTVLSAKLMHCKIVITVTAVVESVTSTLNRRRCVGIISSSLDTFLLLRTRFHDNLEYEVEMNKK